MKAPREMQYPSTKYTWYNGHGTYQVPGINDFVLKTRLHSGASLPMFAIRDPSETNFTDSHESAKKSFDMT